ncbi:uncharacterized protein LOC131149120 [Malania oleifera]|uniref:uncharacterized protein LOC131149120 n=1 Tax=Malania oleifera TaxID=397392 RepID=UPI0025AE4EC5|nr:uncharacterized protein LOC131149120 [Malania oleifera]
MSNGELVSEDPDQVLSIFDYLADNVPQWNTRYTQAPMTAHPISTIGGGDVYEPPNCPNNPPPQYQPQQISPSCTSSDLFEDSIAQMANMLQQFMQTQVDHNNELWDTINAISTQLDILENEELLAEPQPSPQEYQQPQQQIPDVSLEIIEATTTSRSEKEFPQPEMLIVEQPIVPALEVMAEPEEVKEKSEETGPQAEHLVDDETDTHTEYQLVVPPTPSSEIVKSSLPPESDVKEPSVEVDSCNGMMICTPDKKGDQSGEHMIFKESGKTFNVNASKELQVIILITFSQPLVRKETNFLETMLNKDPFLSTQEGRPAHKLFGILTRINLSEVDFCAGIKTDPLWQLKFGEPPMQFIDLRPPDEIPPEPLPRQL